MDNKSAEKYFHVGYCYNNGEADGDGWFSFSDLEVAEFRAFESREREEFLRRCPDDANDIDLWHEWLSDAWAESNFTLADVPSIGIIAGIMWIDLDNPQDVPIKAAFSPTHS